MKIHTNRLTACIVGAIIVLTAVAQAGTVAATVSPSVSAQGGSTTPNGTVTVSVTAQNAQSVKISGIPSSWTVNSHQDAGSIFNNQVSSHEIAGWLWLRGNRADKSVSVTFSVPSNASTQTLNVMAQSKGGATTQTTTTVHIQSANTSPSASFSYTPTSPNTGQTVSFDARNSSDSNGSIISYAWNFTGDGSTDATGVTASTHFSSAGSHTVTLTVTDNDGATDTVTKTVSVSQSHSTSSNGSIAGRVSDSSNSDISDATITVTNANTGTQVARTTTNSNGQYTVSVPGNTNYQVSASATGYSSTSRTISVSSNRTSTANIVIIKHRSQNTTRYQETFEGTSTGSIPPGWRANGNGMISVVHGSSSDTSKVLKASGQSGGCWETVAFDSLGSSTLSKPTTGGNSVTLSFRVRPTASATAGCHGTRNTRIGFNTGNSPVYGGSGTRLLTFHADGTVNAPSNTDLGSYKVGSWNDVKLTYTVSDSATTVTTWINGKRRGTFTRNTPSFASNLAYLQIDTGEYTTYLDNITISTGNVSSNHAQTRYPTAFTISPQSVTAGKPVQFAATNPLKNTSVQYKWSVDNTSLSNTNGRRTTYTFTTAGKHTVSFTATSGSKTLNKTTHTLTVNSSQTTSPAPAPKTGATLFAADSQNASPGSTVNVPIKLHKPPDNIGAYGFNVSVTNQSVATISSVQLHGNPGVSSNSTTKRHAHVSAALASIKKSTNVSLVTLTLKTHSSGQTELQITNPDIALENGTTITLADVQNTTLTVSNNASGPVVVGSKHAETYKGSSKYLDVNGDGKLTISDVQAFFANRNQLNGNTKFDYNGNGKVDIGDVQKLFHDVTS